MEDGWLIEAIALAGVLLLYSNTVNRLPRRVHDRFYVLINLSFLGLVLAWAVWAAGMTAQEIGLTWPQSWTSALWGLALSGVIISPVLILAAFPRLRMRLKDPRVSALTLRQVVSRAFIRIPLGTALFEEMLFRGILFALLSRTGTGEAVWASSLVFSLWHIVPTLHLIKASRLTENRALGALAFLGGLAATFAGGVFFALLRHYTDSVIGPIVAHAVINSVALVAAFLGQRGGQEADSF